MAKNKSVPRDNVITLRVSEDEAREWRLASRAEDVTLSELIRRAVRERAEKLSTGG